MTGYAPVRTAPGPWTGDELRAMPARGFQKHLGLAVEEIGPDVVAASVAIAERHLNSVGSVHGGVVMAIGDSLGAMGALQHLAPDQRTATLESKTSFIVPAGGPSLRAVCRPVHIGRRTSVWSTSVLNGAGRLVAVVTQTQLHFTD